VRFLEWQREILADQAEAKALFHELVRRYAIKPLSWFLAYNFKLTVLNPISICCMPGAELTDKLGQ